jgi:C4-dicarboxylate-specific signal transduction histidine kinase
LRGVLVDITDRKTAEEQVARQQAELAHVARVSTVGEMASRLAHEINQPLTAVVNYSQGAMRRLRAASGVHADVLEAIEAASVHAHRAAEIIRRLSSFVQKREPRRSSCDLNQTIREVIGFSAADARDHHVQIRLNPTVDLPLVQADDIQIQQVILNLVRNGIEAMAEVESRERILEIRTSPVGDAVEVAVSDNGSGLTSEAQERIFTPFFTTKPQGMGMGLSISRSIIDAHGGRLWATPNPDGGTTFQFTIPVSGGAMSDET